MASVKPAGQLDTAHDKAKTLCEFFAGIGLVREGLSTSGWQCVYANDIDPKKLMGYQARFGTAEHFHLGDLWNTHEVVARIPDQPFLATASFPCIDLSVAGHYNRGLSGDHSSTFFAFTDVLEAMGDRKPAVVMVENVVGFLTSRKGADFADAARTLAELGYWLDAVILDASHFTPQSRPRIFLFGFKAEVPLPEPAETEAGWLWAQLRPSVLRPASLVHTISRLDLPTGWANLRLPDPPTRRSNLIDLIDLDEDQLWWDTAEVSKHYRIMSDSHREKIDAHLTTGERWAGTIFRRIRHGSMRAEVRFDGLAGCLRTPKGGSAKQIVVATIGGELRMRWMSPVEYARLQGVPNFPLVGTTIQQLWGFADAVCVPAISWIDEHILSPIHASATAGRTATVPRQLATTAE
jgi:DNA (cytosine-5)-methyltransferase 1